MKWILPVFATFFWPFLLLAQSPLDQKIDFEVANVSLEEAAKLLVKKTNLSLSYNDKFFKKKSAVNLRFRNTPIRQILDEISRKADLKYKLIGSQIAFSPQKKRNLLYSYSGVVTDAETREDLIGASVRMADSDAGTITNEYGYFNLKGPGNETEIEIRYVGYSPKRVTLKAGTFVHNISLDSDFTLEEIVVTPDLQGASNHYGISSKIGNNIASPKFQQTLGGEPDLIRNLERETGVQTGSDGIGGVYVRGGNADQNLTLLDGVPVYNPYHLLGLFSVYNPSAIRNARFIKGAFPANYGGRISSVIDVYMKEGNRESIKAGIGGSLVGLSANIEGPLFNKKASFMIAGRRTDEGLLFNTVIDKVFSNGSLEGRGYDFFDFNSKVNFDLSNTDKLFVSVYGGFDDFQGEIEGFENIDTTSESTESRLFWGNTIAAVRWNHVFNDHTFSNLTAAFSNYDFDFKQYEEIEDSEGEEESYFYLQYASRIQNFGLQYSIDVIPNERHEIKMGLSYNRQLFTPEAVFANEETFFHDGDEINIGTFDQDTAKVFSRSELAFFALDKVHISEQLRANLGVRATAYLGEGTSHFAVEPRLILTYLPNKKIEVVFGVSRMVQFIHRVSSSGLNLPDEVWIPSSTSVKPQDGWQGDIGMSAFITDQLTGKVSIYAKKMNRIPSFSDSIPYFDSQSSLDQNLTFGKGFSKGIEFELEKKGGLFEGYINYTWAATDRRFDLINRGVDYPFRFDRRHNLKMGFSQRVLKHGHIQANWTFGSSNPEWTVSGNLLDDGFSSVTSIDQKNEERGDHYHRLDLSIGYHLKKKRFSHALEIGVYNAYNKKNAAFYKIASDVGGTFTTEPVELFGTMPSVSYRLTFQ